MRPANSSLAALLGALVCVSLPATATAAPSVKMKARIVPIQRNLRSRHGRTWKGTGDILGAPAAVEARMQIKGSEYDGFPAPLRAVDVYLPKGTKINAKRFKTCPSTRLMLKEPERCPRGSLAGPPGVATGTVRFGSSEPVKEAVTVQGYFTGGKGLSFWIEGRHPVVIERVAEGSLHPMRGRFSKELETSVPLIETVPGAPFASTESIDVTVGAAYMRHKRLISYGVVPTRCPRGGFPVKAQLAFGAGPSSQWQHVTLRSKVRCPKRSRRHGAHDHSHRHHHKARGARHHGRHHRHHHSRHRG